MLSSEVQFRLSRLAHFCFFFIIVTLISCFSESGDTRALKEAVRVGQLNVESFRVEASQPVEVIGANEQVQYHAYVVDIDNVHTEVTAEVRWSLDIPNTDSSAFATIDQNGLLTANALENEFTSTSLMVVAQFANLTAVTSVVVSNAVLVALSISPETVTIDECQSDTFTVLGTFSDQTVRGNIVNLQFSTSDVNLGSFDRVAPVSGTANQRVLRTFNATLDPLIVTVASGLVNTTATVTLSDTLTSLTLLADRTTLDITNQTQVATVTAVGDYNGREQDVTTQTTFSAQSPTEESVLTVTGNTLTAIKAGDAVVNGSCGGQSNQLLIKVIEIDDYVVTDKGVSEPIEPGETFQLTFIREYSDGVTEDDVSADELTEWGVITGGEIIVSIADGEVVMADSFIDFEGDTIEIEAKYDNGNADSIKLKIETNDA